MCLLHTGPYMVHSFVVWFILSSKWVQWIVLFFFSQVWQCVCDGSSSNKRSQFELLAELEHDTGVSEAVVVLGFMWGQFVWIQLILVPVVLFYPSPCPGERRRSESSGDSAGDGL